MVRTGFLLTAAITLTVTGCASLPWMRTTAKTAAETPALATTREGSTSATSNIQQTASFTSSPTFATPNATSMSPLAAHPLEQDDAVLHELQAIGSVDPVAAQQLVARLQDVKPSLRPLVARQFRTSWDYHRQLTGKAPLETATHDHAQPVEYVASLPAEYHPASSSMPATMPAATPPATSPQTSPPAGTPAVPPVATPPTSPAAPATTSAAQPPQASTPAPATEVVTAAYESNVHLLPTPDSPARPLVDEVETPRDWQDALTQTIDGLTSQSPTDPRSTDQAYQHVRLRLLHLVAGDKEKALEPIPGLTPTEQTYWSNQFFAIATLLEYDQHADDERRASLAAEQLAEAQAKLGELSNLAIRSMAFCEKVYGFGDYDPLPKETFKPGQSVTLYAEIDNFRSESTEKGYHTSLATSYEVLDQAGNRVEGGEFAVVDDYCRNKRQDFYIEYTFQLPSRIYASKYQLRLLIRDRLSGKIGKSTAEFEIGE